MSSRAMIDEFMAQKSLALVRASRNKRISGVSIDKELGAKDTPFPSCILTKRKLGPSLLTWRSLSWCDHRGSSRPVDEAVCQAVEAKIPRIWMQRGCESKPALQLCEEKESGNSWRMRYDVCRTRHVFHAFHRWIMKFLENCELVETSYFGIFFSFWKLNLWMLVHIFIWLPDSYVYQALFQFLALTTREIVNGHRQYHVVAVVRRFRALSYRLHYDNWNVNRSA